MSSPGPALCRAAAAGGPGQRGLTGDERQVLGSILLGLINEWWEPRLFREPAQVWDLTGADIARIGLIWRDLAPPPDHPSRPLVVNAADWAAPPAVPGDWVIVNAARPVQGPASMIAWQDEQRHGPFYGAWPLEDDDDAYWEQSGAREVRVTSNHEIAAKAGQYLAAAGLLPGEGGLLPGEGGLQAVEVARRLTTPWKEGVLDDEEVTRTALAAILEVRRDDEDKAYDFSDAPQRRELAPAERGFLSRLAGRAAADPRWAQEQVARHPGIRAALGDGNRPQARPLTVRERDDIARMTGILRSEYLYDRVKPGSQPPSRWTAEISGADIARLELIDNAITPRRGDRPIDDQFYVNAADWAPPRPVTDGWVTGAAMVPLSGPLSWQDNSSGQPMFFAAAPPGDDPFEMWQAESDGTARRVKTVTDEQAAEFAYAFLASYQCAAPKDAGLTVTEVARDLGYPLPAERAAAAVAAASTAWTLRVTRAGGGTRWYAVHGSRARDLAVAGETKDKSRVTKKAVTAPQEAIPAKASPAARAMAERALQHGWDVVYTRGDTVEQVTAMNPEPPVTRVSQTWIVAKHLVDGDDLQKIAARPRPRCAAPQPEAGGPVDPVACGFPATPHGTTPAPAKNRNRTRTAPTKGARPGA